MSDIIKFSQEDMDAAIKTLIRAGKSMTRGVEKALVMAVFDSIVNESPAMANALIGALRQSTKRQGIVAFLEKFGQLYDKGGKTGFVHFAHGAQARLKWDAEYSHLVQEEAESWETFKPAPTTPDALDVFEAVEALVTKVQNAQKKEREVVHADMVEYLQALMAQYVERKAMEKARAESQAVVDMQAKVQEAIAA